jgi:predicted nucleic acid-binding protein
VRLFLDANVIFSAAHSPEGRARALFRLAEKARCTLVASPHAVEEARRNIMLKSSEAVQDLEHLLQFLEVVVEADPRLVAWAADQGLPENDAPILAAAVAARADALITGDRTHFVHLFGSSPGGVRVITPAEALSEVLD